jgi:hypothetical protein
MLLRSFIIRKETTAAYSSPDLSSALASELSPLLRTQCSQDSGG